MLVCLSSDSPLKNLLQESLSYYYKPVFDHSDDFLDKVKFKGDFSKYFLFASVRS